MRVFAAGVFAETNTFCPVPTALSDFIIERDDGDAPYPRNLPPSWSERAFARGDTLIVGLMARAQPSGVTVRYAYETLRDEILERLRAAAPVDVVLLNLHGAMVADGYDDCEGDLLTHVRRIAGVGTAVGVLLDLHCHLTPPLLAEADVVITYKEYPHNDIDRRAAELFDIAVATRDGTVRPTMAVFDCRMIGLYPTTVEPMRTFVDEMRAAEGRDGVLSLSFAHGFQFADLPFLGARMLAVTNNDVRLASELAEQFGMAAHGLRNRIGFESMSEPMEAALTRAVGGKSHPIVVADQSDNAGGGAPGDATFALRWLLARGATDVATAFLYDPEAVRIAQRGGVGANLDLRLGGKLGRESGPPLDLRVQVLSLLPDYQHAFPQKDAAPILRRAGDVAALRCDGDVDIIVASERTQCFCPSVFVDLGIDPRAKRILLPKSTQHFYGAFAPIAAEVIYMAAPGATAPDPRLIDYGRFDPARLYPWADDPFAAGGPS